MRFDKILDLTAGVYFYFYFYNMTVVVTTIRQSTAVTIQSVAGDDTPCLAQ